MASRTEDTRKRDDNVDEAGRESFPASDPPAFNPAEGDRHKKADRPADVEHTTATADVDRSAGAEHTTSTADTRTEDAGSAEAMHGDQKPAIRESSRTKGKAGMINAVLIGALVLLLIWWLL